MALKGVRQALILKHASASRSSGQWNDDDFDVFANGIVVGRIFIQRRTVCSSISATRLI